MTLSSELTKVQYNGDDSTTAFAISFIYWDDTDIKVIHKDASGTETTWVDGTQYTLTGGSGSTGTLNVNTSPTDYTPATGESLTIKSDRSDTQDDALPLGGAFPSTVVEQALDQQARLIQQKEEELSRSVKLAETSTQSGITLEDPVVGQYLRWTTGNTIESVVLSLSNTASSVDETDTNATKDKLVSNNLAFLWEAVRTAWNTFDAVLTTKGDLLSYSTVRARLGVGTEGQKLTPDTAETTGLRWGNQVPTLAKSGTYTVLATDQGDMLLLSGASFTVTLPSAATVGAGFLIGFKFTGTEATQQYTIDPDGSETIDGASTHILKYDNEIVWLTSDGTNWQITHRTHKIGDWVQHDRQEASSSANIDFTDFPAVSEEWRIRILKLVAATDQVELWARVQESAAWQADVGDYAWGSNASHETAPTDDGSVSAAEMVISGLQTASDKIGNAAGEYLESIISFNSPENSSLYFTMKWETIYLASDTAITRVQGAGVYQSNVNAITGLRILLESGNITSGSFILEKKVK